MANVVETHIKELSGAVNSLALCATETERHLNNIAEIVSSKLDIRMRIGQRLKQLADEKLLCPKHLGWDAGIEPSHVYAIYRGEINVSIGTLNKFCFALGINISQFFDDPMFD